MKVVVMALLIVFSILSQEQVAWSQDTDYDSSLYPSDSLGPENGPNTNYGDYSDYPSDTEAYEDEYTPPSKTPVPYDEEVPAYETEGSVPVQEDFYPVD